MRSIVIVASLVGVAAADAPEPATPAASPEDAFAQVVAAAYKDLGDTLCATGCSQQVIGDGVVGKTHVELRKTTSDPADAYAVVFGRGNTWWAADPLLDIQVDNCATGKCWTDAITNLAVTDAGGFAWVTVSVRTTTTWHYEEPHHSEVHDYQYVIGCKLASTPTCTQIRAGSRSEDGSATIGRDRVVVRTDSERISMPATW